MGLAPGGDDAMKTWMMLAGMLGMLVQGAMAGVQTRAVEYRDGEVVLEGVLAWDDAVEGPRPGVVVIHAWTGLGDYEQRRARELADLGYAALAIDMYGKDVRPQGREEAGALSGRFKADRGLMRSRARAGLDALAAEAICAGQPMAAIGYCFGGTVALELARSGAPLAGTVSIHGNLDTPNPEDAAQIQGPVLVLHGGDDPVVPPAEVLAFQEEMRAAGVDWQFTAYGGAVHAFSDPSRGAAYHPAADRRSWQSLKNFLEEIFAR
jgi:dienelactone hydrolase